MRKYYINMKTLELRLRDVVVIDLREELNMPHRLNISEQRSHLGIVVVGKRHSLCEQLLLLQPTATAHTSTQPAADIKKVNSTRHQKWR